MHPVEDYLDIITLTVNRFNECEIVTPTKRRCTLNYYITQCTGNLISWRQDAVEKASTQQSGPSGHRLSSYSWRSDDLGIRRVGDKMPEWGICPREAWPPRPRLSSPGERERNAVMTKRVGVNMLQFCSVSNSLSHTTFSNKLRGIFSKNCVARLYCVVVMILHAYANVCIVGYGNTTKQRLFSRF